MGFADHLELQCERVLREVDAKIYSIAYHLFTNIVLRTPSPENPGKWAKGVLANQWYPQVGGEYSNSAGTNSSPTGSDSLSRINTLSSSLVFYKKDGTITMTNNVPYAWQAEWGGWVRTPAYHMVASSLNDAKAGLL